MATCRHYRPLRLDRGREAVTLRFDESMDHFNVQFLRQKGLADRRREVGLQDLLVDFVDGGFSLLSRDQKVESPPMHLDLTRPDVR